MRTKEEIMAESKKGSKHTIQADISITQKLILEVLIDVRDILKDE